ncbi:hypothetical protein C2W62_21220 [Candidatus Entotheonella serta]|nr:hypothetical protein C2W62_21220 [Candidatus Entotheonella serta]
MPENADQEIENYIRQGQQFTQNEEDDAAERVFLLAWNLLVDTYHYRIFQLCYMQCDRQQEDAEDITQETFLGAYKAMAKLRFDASLYTWLCAIAKNQCRAWWRKQQKVVGHKETLKDTPHVEPPRSDEVQVRQEDIQQILDCVASLKPKYKEIFCSVHYYEKSYQETAELFQIKISLVRKRYERAKKMIYECVKKAQ